jgi:hypothetical protein
LISGNWSISRYDKVKLTKYQNHHHHGGVFDTWTKWVKPQAQRAQVPASRPCFMSVWPTASRTHVYMRSRRPRQWRKLVEAAPPDRPDTWLDRPATTWCQTDSSKSMELPYGPINTPPMVEMRGHTPHFGDSTCKALILSVVARCSLVGGVARLRGPEGLSKALLVARARKLCRNPSGSNRVSRL